MNDRTRKVISVRVIRGISVLVALGALMLPATSSFAGVPTGSEAEATTGTAEIGAPVAAPQLSIAIDNGRTSTNTGDKLDYVISVQNLGVADIDALQINQSMPTGMEFGTADSDGAAEAGYVTWTVDLKATTTATLRTSMTVAATPADLLRLASVACASIAADGPPIVCASHSDQLPAGAAAEAAQAAMVAPPAPESQPWWYVLAGLAVFVGLGGLVAWWIIRKRRQPAPEVTDVEVLTS